MSLDGKILRRAKLELEQRRKKHENEYERRQELVYSCAPKIRELDIQLRRTMAELAAAAFLRDNAAKVAELRTENLFLQAERKRELTARGFSADYLDDSYDCEKCHDSGYIRTNICECLMEIYKEEQTAELSKLLRLGEETFDTFSLDWYTDIPDAATGVSARDCMDVVYNSCVQYALKFGSGGTSNLFLSGGTGLGKTFLSACIAKTVSESGFSVVYDTAVSIFAAFEKEKFSYEQDEELSRETARFMECDLLILDDLGTEMTTSFVVSALYNLINTRLITGKRTVINSNLTADEIRARYSPQIASRIAGDYQVLNFYGTDIRMLKKQ